MSNCLIVGDSYIAHTVTNNIDHILNRNFDYIYLLADYHSKNELFYEKIKHKIRIENSVETCVQNSDIILIFKDTLASFEKIHLIIELSQIYHKEYVVFDSSIEWQDEKHCAENRKSFGVPSILILSLGEYTQLFCTEMQLNRLFSALGTIRQEFSPGTQKFINELNKYQIIDRALIACQMETSPELRIFSIVANDFRQIFIDNEIKEKIESNRPSTSVLCINSRTTVPQEFIMCLGYIYQLNVCAIVRSDYIPLYNCSSDVIPALYQDNKDSNSPFASYMYTQKEIFESDVLIDSILPHIWLPEGISLIN